MANSVTIKGESGGAIGIGTTSPETHLHVDGNVAVKNGSNYSGYFDNDGAVTLYHNGSSKIATTSAGVSVTGNVVMATNGGGIDFSATSDAGGMASELLDDYEEGTFTPNCDSLGDAATYQYSKYIKIGRQVSFTVRINMPSTSDSSGFALSGFPFTCDAEYAVTCKINYSMNDLLHFMINTAEICYGYYGGSSMAYSVISGKELIITGTYFTE